MYCKNIIDLGGIATDSCCPMHIASAAFLQVMRNREYNTKLLLKWLDETTKQGKSSQSAFTKAQQNNLG